MSGKCEPSSVQNRVENPADPVNAILATRRIQVLQPQLLTRPQCFYLGLDMEVR